MSSSSSFPALNKGVTLNNGLSIPLLGLGTWRSDKGLVEKAVYEALRVGYRHIDCARVYGNEEEVGAGVQRAIDEKIVRREDIFITSKVWCNARTKELIESETEKSLNELKTTYLDLLLIHWPISMEYDAASMWPKNEKGFTKALLPEDNKKLLKDTYQTLEGLVKSGKVKSIGISNFNKEEVEYIFSFCTIPPVVNQVECHVWFLQDELRSFLKTKNVLIEAYCPLANLRRPGQEDNTPLNDPVIKKIGEKYNKSPAQVLLRFLLQHGENIVLPKSTTPERIVENSQIFDFTLSEEDMTTLKKIGEKNIRFVNPDFRGPNGEKVFPE